MSENISSGSRFQGSRFRGYYGLFAVLAGVLACAVGLIIYGETRPLERTFHGSVKELLPTENEVPGWKVSYLPIADTPEIQAKVDELLNYDDAVYAVYTNGVDRISIYVAYWTPGKMSQRLVAAHTPDVCWVGAGWKILGVKSGAATGENRKTESGELRTQAGDRVSEKASTFQPHSLESMIVFDDAEPAVQLIRKLESHIDGFKSNAGEWRLMRRNEHLEQVAFWHLSGGEVVSYGVGKPKWWTPLVEAAEAFDQQREQFFIRISSPSQISGY